MEHIQDLVKQSTDDIEGPTFSGHAMMASCPPESHVLDRPDIPWGSKTYDIPADDLNTLLNLSPKLTAIGEITPIM